jgi:protein-S-isoprenylcysteine O-methyltransferase Ste14
MQPARAIAGSALFLVVAPGTVAGVLPWWLTRWRSHPAPTEVRVAGAMLIAASLPVLANSFVRFAREGRGTPAPVAPTEDLVVTGPYRHVRNPMYLAVEGAILGQAMLLGRPILVGYAAAAGAAMTAFAKLHEEPALARRYGAAYESYRQAVPAWIPRLRRSS